jgi:hypothetical protein
MKAARIMQGIPIMTEVCNDFGVELVWNKGIAALCDRRIPDEFSDRRNYSPVPTLAGAMASSKLPDNLISNPQPYSDIRDGELVWVRIAWLKSFIKQVLPLVNARIVLVTGDSDSCVPSELGAEGRVLLESPKIAHWYTQDYDGSIASEKLSPIPIGMDYHMLSEGTIWGESAHSLEQQEAALKSVAAQLSPREERIQKVYVDFAWQWSFGVRHYRRYHPMVGGRWETRRRTARKLRGRENVVSQNNPLPRTEMWRARGEYAFVVSPHGIGLDCHRTWEALALGHIVLVTASSLDPLYTDLPVVPLNDWNEITSSNLRKWQMQFQGNYGMREKLTSRYWVARMRGSGGRDAPPER